LKLGAYLGGIRDSIRQCVQLGLGLAIVEIGWVIHRAHCSLRHTRTDDSFMYGRGFWHSIMPLKWLNSFPSNFTEIFLSYQWWHGLLSIVSKGWTMRHGLWIFAWCRYLSSCSCLKKKVYVITKGCLPTAGLCWEGDPILVRHVAPQASQAGTCSWWPREHYTLI
jgi:hypothetical protein